MLTVSLPGRSERRAPGGKWKARLSALPSRAMGRHRVRRVGMAFATRTGAAPSQGTAGGWSDGDCLVGEDARCHPLVPARSGQPAESVLAVMVRKRGYVLHSATAAETRLRCDAHSMAGCSLQRLEGGLRKGDVLEVGEVLPERAPQGGDLGLRRVPASPVLQSRGRARRAYASRRLAGHDHPGGDEKAGPPPHSSGPPGAPFTSMPMRFTLATRRQARQANAEPGVRRASQACPRSRFRSLASWIVR